MSWSSARAQPRSPCPKVALWQALISKRNRQSGVIARVESSWHCCNLGESPRCGMLRNLSTILPPSRGFITVGMEDLSSEKASNKPLFSRPCEFPACRGTRSGVKRVFQRPHQARENPKDLGFRPDSLLLLVESGGILRRRLRHEGAPLYSI